MYLRPGFVVVIVGATLTSLSTIIVGLRYYCRYFLMGSVSASDHLMFTALVLSWGNFVVNYLQDQSSSKSRPSFFRIPEKRPLIENTVRMTLITWWVYRMSYILALCFVKLSILFFYRAIASQRTFRRLVYATMVFVCVYTFAACMASAFQCQNPADAWSTTDYFAQFDRVPSTKRRKLKCLDPAKLFILSSAANLLSDVIIMMLPIPTILKLRIPLRNRLALIGVFAIGIIAIVASSVRMWVMTIWAESPENSARFGTDLLLWGQVETNSGIISASVPFLRLLFQSRKEEERILMQRVMVVSPPKPMGIDNVDCFSQHKELDLDTWPLHDEEEGDSERDPNWGPFITVPKSLSSGIKGSTLLEPKHHPLVTV
ncbi:hypothetical protein EJ02DRAFT_466686 [Clathrospora elynae]|uniref:Rhodopsin domain-containing protein n=1 Tax=Clathrospora elynae TaxID=706981 RepID=A0A6A5SNI1_9PLEO|nr:hypothetical protein EJ02DRAFT_466686 [Clathrospora elynae]